MWGKKKPSKKELEKINTDLEGLVSHLKSERKEWIESYRDILNTILSSVIEFLSEEEKLYRAYLFLGNQGQIITYTHALRKLLGIEKNVRRRNYHELFEGLSNYELHSVLRKKLPLEEEIEFKGSFTIKGNERKLTIIKEKPHYLETKLPRGFGGEDKSVIRIFTPIEFREQSFFSRRKYPDIAELLDEYQLKLRKIYPELIRGGWTWEKIEQYLSLHGAKGLLECYEKRKK